MSLFPAGAQFFADLANHFPLRRLVTASKHNLDMTNVFYHSLGDAIATISEFW
jgi:hypothetical protein